MPDASRKRPEMQGAILKAQGQTIATPNANALVFEGWEKGSPLFAVERSLLPKKGNCRRGNVIKVDHQELVVSKSDGVLGPFRLPLTFWPILLTGVFLENFKAYSPEESFCLRTDFILKGN